MRRLVMLGLIALLGFGIVGVSDNTETVSNHAWDFTAGWYGFDFQSGNDARVDFFTTGFGSAHGTARMSDCNSNPYNYGVDTTRAQVKANVDDGTIAFYMVRQDTRSGPAGQVMSTTIDAFGEASFATNTRMNWHGVVTSNYAFQNNSQFTAAGSWFEIDHYIHAGDPDSHAGFYATGDGSVDVTLMSHEMRGASFWRFGEGAGCYTNAEASGTGSGYFEVYGAAPNSLRHPFGGEVPGGGSIVLQINYNDGFNLDAINMRGD